ERLTWAVGCETLPARGRPRFASFALGLYISSSAQGALSDAVRAAYEQYLRDWDEYGAPWEYWVDRGEAARASFADLINAAPEEVAVTTSESAGVAALASGLRYARRSKVVLTDWEFPTIGQIWHAQESRGARVVHVPAGPDGTIPIESFARATDDDGLVRGQGHLRDGPHGLLPGAHRLSFSVGHAADSGDLRRHRGNGADEGDRHRGDAGARTRASGAPDRRHRRAAGDARHAA